MGRKYLIVVDMQNDFTYGALRNEDAINVIPAVVKKVQNHKGNVVFTMDTHYSDYLNTQEGKNLPIPHCISHTEGWELIPKLDKIKDEKSCRVYLKNTFSCVKLAHDLKEENKAESIDEIELVGVCTDICVISNAMLLKAFLPEVKIVVDAGCCAGVTKESHEKALDAMRACQIEIIGG